MTEYLKYFFNPRHILSLAPPAMSDRAIAILVAAFTILTIAGIVSKISSQKIHDGLMIKAYRKLSNAFITIGVLGYIYVFFAWQGVRLFSSRLILLILAAVFAVWLWFIIKYLVFDIPKSRSQIQKKKEFEKYLP